MKKNIIVLILILILSTCSVVVASNDVISVIGGGGLSNGETDELGNVTANILGLIRWAGYAIALGAILWLGVKYVIAAADERATLKGAAWKYILGAFLISSASAVLGIIMEMKG
jgi:hypothetical protein